MGDQEPVVRLAVGCSCSFGDRGSECIEKSTLVVGFCISVYACGFTVRFCYKTALDKTTCYKFIVL
jgi:hypothetical protein